jgi:membrane protease YdiL (CAAX protease family)
MTDLPDHDPAPIDYASPTPHEPPPQRAAWPRFLGWVVIMLAVAVAFMHANFPQQTAAELAVPADNELNLLIISRYAVGTHSFGGRGGPFVEESHKMLESMDQAARTERDRVRVATVAGYLVGPKVAAQRLVSLYDHVAEEDEPLAGDIKTLLDIYRDETPAPDEPAQQRLIDRYGYFARLALAHDRPADDPLRRQVIAEGRRTFVVLIAFMIMAFLAVASGLVLLIVGIVFFLSGRWRSDYAPDRTISNAFLHAFAIYVAGLLLLGQVVDWLAPGERSFVWTVALMLTMPLGLLWPIIRGEGTTSWRHAFGWHGGRGFFREIGLGVVGYIAGLPVIIVGFIITAILISISGETPSHPIQQAFGNMLSPLKIVVLYSLACVWAPVTEELMFRGALYHHLRRRWGWLVSAAWTSLIFAAVHPQGWTAIPVLGSIALVLATLREWRGSIIAPIIAHACVNGVTITLMILILG